MDPDAALVELLEIARHDTREEYHDARMAELVLALDEWLRRGGFLPASWFNAYRQQWPV